MGNTCGGGGGSDENRKRHQQVEKSIRADGKAFKEQIRILLLGPGESGKSTVFKQMKILQVQGGYTEEEKVEFRSLIYTNCVSEMRTLIENAKLQGNDLSSDNEKTAAWFIDTCSEAEVGIWTKDIGEAIQKIWLDSGIKKTYATRGELYHLNDSAEYFFHSIDRYLNPNFIPDVNDILRTRVRTSGFEEANFSFADMNFTMTDVGGQRTERRKWIHCFDCVTAVLFCASINDYDLKLREDNETNRMKDAITLFSEVSTAPWFKKSLLILFLNKRDLFEKKILLKDLKCCWQNYQGGNDFTKAVDFIKNRFMETSEDIAKRLVIHVTVATETKSIADSFAAVRVKLLENNVGEFLI